MLDKYNNVACISASDVMLLPDDPVIDPDIVVDPVIIKAPFNWTVCANGLR